TAGIHYHRPLGRSLAGGETKGAGLSRRLGVARSSFLLRNKFIFQNKFLAFLRKTRGLPMRRRDLAWLAIFLDPPTRLRRPLSELKASAYVILKNDEFPIPWSGVDS